MEIFFADAIGNLNVIGSTVRIEFVRITGIDSVTKKPTFEPCHHLVMPLQGFSQGVNREVALQKKLVEAGLVPSNKIGTADSEVKDPSKATPTAKVRKAKGNS